MDLLVSLKLLTTTNIQTNFKTMKTRIILIVVSAIITLSFTLVSVNKKEPVKVENTSNITNEPLGGFISQEKL